MVGLTLPGVVVLGGTGSIGSAVVGRLATGQTPVLFTYLDRKDLADEVEHDLRVAHHIRADIQSEADLAFVAAEARSQFGSVRAVINAAGSRPTTTFHSLDDDSWAEVMRVQLLGPLLIARTFAPLITESGGGAIVFIGSVAGIRPEPRSHEYVAAKAGLVGLTRSLALELAPSITVNSVAPGWLSTPRTPRDDRDGALRAARIPLRRLGSAEDVVDVVELLQKPGGYLTGQTIIVDGGYAL